MYRAREMQLSFEDILPPDHGTLNPANRWVRLADQMEWDTFEQAYGTLFANGGKVALPARVAFGVRIIQVYYGLPDRKVVELVRESPYLQYFLGQNPAEGEVPFSARSVARFRARIPAKAVRSAVRLLHSYTENP